MKFKIVYLIFVLILFIDLTLTFVALNLREENYEGNPIARYLFDNYGILGYFLQFLFGSFLLFLLTLLLFNLSFIDRKLNKLVKLAIGVNLQRLSAKQIKKLTYGGIIIYSFLHLSVVINNIMVIFRSL